MALASITRSCNFVLLTPLYFTCFKPYNTGIKLTERLNMLRATEKYAYYPTPEQAEFLTAQFGAVRFAYNKALHIKSHAYRLHKHQPKP